MICIIFEDKIGQSIWNNPQIIMVGNTLPVKNKRNKGEMLMCKDNKKDKKISVLLNEDTLQQLQEAAEQADVSVSAYTRRLIVKALEVSKNG
jgi:hypothetical protein